MTTLKEAAESRGITAGILAAKMGVSERHAENWINHRKKIHRFRYNSLRLALEMSWSEFEDIIQDLKVSVTERNPRIMKYNTNICFTCSQEMKEKLSALAQLKQIKSSELIRNTIEKILRNQTKKIKQNESTLK